MAMDARTWVRNLLEDLPSEEVESSTTDGATSTFYVGNPPINPTSLVVVSVDGTARVQGTDYTVQGSNRIAFVNPPPVGANVVIQYTRVTFSDSDLDHFLTEAGREFSELRPRVYRAALLASNALLYGASTALDFGAGAERFEVTTIFDRMSRFRAARQRD